MQKAIGVICLAVGILLLVWGHNITQAVGSQFQKLFTGSTPDKAMYFYVSGVILLVVGAFQLFSQKK